MTQPVHTFKAQYNAVNDRSTGYKCTLIRIDNVAKSTFESIINDSSNNFINDIAKANRPKIFDTFRMLGFRNKSFQLLSEPPLLRIFKVKLVTSSHI